MSTEPEYIPGQSHDGPAQSLPDIQDAVEGIEGLFVDFEPDGAWEIGGIRFSQEIDQLLPALLEAQKQIEHAKRDAENAYFSTGRKKATYATLESVVDATKPHLNKHGLLMLQGIRATYTDAAPTIAQQAKAAEMAIADFALGRVPVADVTTTTMIVHAESAQWMAVTITLRTRQDDAHGIGSGITYGRRYTAQTVTALPTEDDDGNAATGRTFVGAEGAQASRAPAGAAQEEPGTIAVPAREKGIKRFHATWRGLIKELVFQLLKGEPDPKDAMKRAFLYGFTKGEVKKGADLSALQAHAASNRLRDAREPTLVWLNDNGPGGWRATLAKYELENQHPVVPMTPEEEEAANERDGRTKADAAVNAIIEIRTHNPELTPEEIEANKGMMRLAIYRHYSSRQHDGPDTMTPDQAIGFAEILTESTDAITEWLDLGQWLKEVTPEDRKEIAGGEESDEAPPAPEENGTPPEAEDESQEISEEAIKVPF